jgi:hypothetical protein
LFQQAAEPAGVGQHGAFGGVDDGERDIEVGPQTLAAAKLAIQRDDDVAKGGAEMIRDRGEPSLRAADREGWEDVQDQRSNLFMGVMMSILVGVGTAPIGGGTPNGKQGGGGTTLPGT